jgi:hypothetical protein
VGRIGLDYRKSLFSSTYEDPSLYEAAKKEIAAFFSTSAYANIVVLNFDDREIDTVS